MNIFRRTIATCLLAAIGIVHFASAYSPIIDGALVCGTSLYACFAAAVDDLEVGSASAAGVERREVGSFFYRLVKDDFTDGCERWSVHIRTESTDGRGEHYRECANLSAATGGLWYNICFNKRISISERQKKDEVHG